MTKLRGYLPDVFKKHTLVVFTHCQVPSKCIFDKKKLPYAPIEETNMFYMENSMFSIDPRKYCTLARDDRQLYEFEWKKAIKSMESLVVRMTELGDSLTASLVEVRQSRDQLKAALCDMKLQMVGLQNAQDELDNIERLMKQAAGDKSQFAKFTKTNHITEKKMVDVPYHSTMCGECNHVCHHQCGLDEIAEKGSNQFTSCAAFGGSGNNCRYCPGKCSYTLHFHDRKNIVEETKTVEEVLDDIKQKFDLATQQYDDAGRKLTGVRPLQLIIPTNL
jgi:predicted RNase H-like HicB family nuclease